MADQRLHRGLSCWESRSRCSWVLGVLPHTCQLYGIASAPSAQRAGEGGLSEEELEQQEEERQLQLQLQLEQQLQQQEEGRLQPTQHAEAHNNLGVTMRDEQQQEEQQQQEEEEEKMDEALDAPPLPTRAHASAPAAEPAGEGGLSPEEEELLALLEPERREHPRRRRWRTMCVRFA
eukprot:gene10866-biopygen10253